jgi:uncharacterized protein
MNLLEFIQTILLSRIFVAMALTFLITHTIKFFIHHYRFKEWSIDPFFDTGGMPSGHSAITTALTVAIGFETGPSPLFFACAIFTLIIMRDSYGVRKSVSDQADILNALTSEMKVHRKVKIVLGHTPVQVFVGFILGLIIPTLVYLY